MKTSTQLTALLSAIDDINRQDPKLISVENSPQPQALIYGQRMSQCLNKHWPEADETLQIAVRAQHIKRWHLKRSEFSAGKKGYYQWRIALAKYHAQLTEELMRKQGYDAEQAAQTATMIRKENLQTNPNSQTLEDVACLVFLQHYLENFAKHHHEDKIIHILQKTWEKMSERGQNITLSLPLSDNLNYLLNRALTKNNE